MQGTSRYSGGAKQTYLGCTYHDLSRILCRPSFSVTSAGDIARTVSGYSISTMFRLSESTLAHCRWYRSNRKPHNTHRPGVQTTENLPPHNTITPHTALAPSPMPLPPPQSIAIHAYHRSPDPCIPQCNDNATQTHLNLARKASTYPAADPAYSQTPSTSNPSSLDPPGSAPTLVSPRLYDPGPPSRSRISGPACRCSSVSIGGGSCLGLRRPVQSVHAARHEAFYATRRQTAGATRVRGAHADRLRLLSARPLSSVPARPPPRLPTHSSNLLFARWRL